MSGYLLPFLVLKVWWPQGCQHGLKQPPGTVVSDITKPRPVNVQNEGYAENNLWTGICLHGYHHDEVMSEKVGGFCHYLFFFF